MVNNGSVASYGDGLLPSNRMWESAAMRPAVLSDNAVHVWSIALDGTPAFVHQLQKALSVDEAERARRFHFERVRRGYVVTRGLLRTLLGRYLKQAPTAVRLVYNDYGKPALVTGDGAGALHFNVSHSGELALLAFTRRAELGVDLELIRPEIAYEEIAERFFSPLERAALRALPASRRLEGFYRGWTRKEAYIKAKGQGLSLPLERFAVSLDEHEPKLVQVQDDPPETERWSFTELQPAPGYLAALAVAGSTRPIHCFVWPDTAENGEIS